MKVTMENLRHTHTYGRMQFAHVNYPCMYYIQNLFQAVYSIQNNTLSNIHQYVQLSDKLQYFVYV